MAAGGLSFEKISDIAMAQHLTSMLGTYSEWPLASVESLTKSKVNILES